VVIRPALLLLLLLSPAWAEDVVLSPHAREGALYKGQLHCHSTESDGAQSPEELFRAYGEAGYDFVCLSDHLGLTADPGVDGVTWIPASEVHTEAAAGGRWTGHHVNALGIRTAPTSGWDRSQVEAILARIAREGGLAMANHPRLRNRWSAPLLASARPLQLLSIFNTKGYRRANQKLPGSGSLLYASQAQWDQCLAEGQLLWGVAADDCHDVTDPEQFDVGWVRVGAASARAADLLAALGRGDVYACRGAGGEAPDLRVWSRRGDGGRSRVVARSQTPGVTLRWIAQGETVAEGPGPVLTCRIPAGARYLRAEAWDGSGRDQVTYSQPLVVVRGARVEARQVSERWQLTLRDGRGRAVRAFQDLPLRVGDVQLVLPAGGTTLTLPVGVGRSGDPVSAPRGWLATRLGS
jgi:hypothetical protein